MTVLEQIALAWQCLGHAARRVASPALWAPWLALGALQLALVAAIAGFAHPWVSPLAVPLLTAAGDPGALHYPGIFRALPELFARADRALAATAGVLAVGASTALFAARFTGGRLGAGAALARALRRGAALFVAYLPLHLLIVALLAMLHLVATGRDSGGLVRRLVPIAGAGGLVVLHTVFLYAGALVMLEGRSGLAALAALPRTAGRGAVAAFVLCVLVLVPLYAGQALLLAGGRGAAQATPELAAALVAGQVALALLAAFLLTGAATLAFQSALAQAPEAGS